MTKRLYLSSRGFAHPAAVAGLLGLESLAGVPVALIPNAREGRPLLDQRRDVARKREALEKLGLDVYITDLAVYRGRALEQRLAGKPLLWVVGGNTFYLRYRMRSSGFEALVPTLLQEGVVYAGESAGAICAGPTLAPTAILDKPDQAPERIDAGLTLVPFLVVPHWGAKGFERGPEIVAHANGLGIEALRLRDGEAAVVDGAQRRLLPA
jgi:dipeptidase E